MSSDCIGNEKDVELSSKSVSGEVLLEINAFYGVINKLMLNKDALAEQLSSYAHGRNSARPIVKIPETPPGANIDDNIKQALDSYNPHWFVRMVESKGPWDYKAIDKKYEDYGNFNFGATALAFGFKEKWALQGAGVYQIYSNYSKKDWDRGEYVKAVTNFSVSFQGEPYGDDPKDQRQIKEGFRYYKEVYLKNNPQQNFSADDVYKIGFEILASRYPGSRAITRSILRMMEN